VKATSTAVIAAAISVADPVSSRSRLDRRDRTRSDIDARQENRAGRDSRHDETAVPANVEARIDGSDVATGSHSGRVVAARCEAGRLPCGVDTPHLHRHRGETRDAQHQYRHQCGDAEGRLDRDSAAIIGQALVLSARLMMFVSALTIESPVTTV